MNAPGTPTRSEFDTFKVLANLEFVNFEKPDPRSLDFSERVLGGTRDVDVLVDDHDIGPSPPRGYEGLGLASPANAPPEATLSPARSHTSAGRAGLSAAPNPFEGTAIPSVPLGGSPLRPPIAQPAVSGPMPQVPPMPQPRKGGRPLRESTQAEIDAEKESLIAELTELETQGLCKLLRPLTMQDSLEEIQFQYDRVQADLNATQVVDFVKQAIKMGSGMLEMAAKRGGITLIEGYHTNLCRDMERFNRPLRRVYNKYWRRGGMSPEAELGTIIFGSLAYTVVQNKLSGSGIGAAAASMFGGSPSAGNANTDYAKPAAQAAPPTAPTFARPKAPLADDRQNMASKPLSSPDKPRSGPPRMDALRPSSWSEPARPAPTPAFEIIEENNEEADLYADFLQSAREKAEDEDARVKPNADTTDEVKKVMLTSGGATKKKKKEMEL